MIATRRGLAVLALLAGALLVVLVIDVLTRARPADRTLVPGFDEASVVRLGWTAHPVGPYLTIERTIDRTNDKPAATPWRRTAPSRGAVEQAPIASMLATLRGARWHRSEARDPREDAVHLAIDHAGTRTELWIGRPIDATEQAWIGIGDRRFLVDAWVARALTPSPIDLAIRTPLAGIANVDTYSVDGRSLGGQPRAIAATQSTRGLVLDPGFVTELERALAELTIDADPVAPVTPISDGIEIAMAGTKVTLAKAPGSGCETRVYLAASTGDGCVALANAEVVWGLVARLANPAGAIASRALVPVGVRVVTLVDGAALDVTRRPTIDGADVDAEQIVALMTVLRSPVDGTDVIPAPTGASIGTLGIKTGGGDLVVDLYPSNVAMRRGEAVALRLSPEAFAILARGGAAYRDRTPWSEDPTTIAEIAIDAVTYRRGAVLGEWTRVPAGPSDAASIDALVTALARPHVVGVAPTTVVRGRRIRLVVRPPVGAEKTHTLELGTASAAGCPAAIDTTSILLPVEICRLVPR